MITCFTALVIHLGTLGVTPASGTCVESAAAPVVHVTTSPQPYVRVGDFR